MTNRDIQGLPDAPRDKLKVRAERERRSVVQEVSSLLFAALDTQPSLSIMELQGFGKGLWRGVDAAAHVGSEQAAWDWLH
jgi:hypothetical protein